jgi:16S rRNA (guanine527-N7)-methyltransferase
MPMVRVFLLEGNGRKCAFLRTVASRLSLTNVEVVNGRAETWSAGIGACDLVTARALAPLDVVAEYAAPLLRLGGALVVWRGRREESAEAEALRAAEILGLSVSEPVRVEPYPGSEHRHLHVVLKVSETPSRFPRRDGVARKRPLGGR